MECDSASVGLRLGFTHQIHVGTGREVVCAITSSLGALPWDKNESFQAEVEAGSEFRDTDTSISGHDTESLGQSLSVALRGFVYHAFVHLSG